MSELVIFDLGGVLVRGIGIVDRMAEELAVDRQALKADYLLHLDAMMAGLFPVEAYYRHLEERFCVKVEGDLFRRAFKPTVNDRMLELVDTLCGDGMRCVIGSIVTETCSPRLSNTNGWKCIRLTSWSVYHEKKAFTTGRSKFRLSSSASSLGLV